MVTQAFSPLLLKSSTPRVVYVSSMLGSVTMRGQNDNIGYEAVYKAYRISKAALNMVAACDAFEYKGKIKVFAFCPGYVISDLAGERESKVQQGLARSPEDAAREILAVADGEQDAKDGLFLHGDRGAEVYAW
jgi:NAD(P)-dependent dehydrogenase (short-subunit alcohol dehydrogenase family)